MLWAGVLADERIQLLAFAFGDEDRISTKSRQFINPFSL